MKRWNWKLFLLIICCSLIAAISNESLKSYNDILIVGFGFGIPVGLIWAFLTRKGKIKSNE